MARRSPGATSASRPRRRVLVELFFSSRWDRNARRRRSFPVPVTLMRLAAPRSVFILGIDYVSSADAGAVAAPSVGARGAGTRPLGRGEAVASPLSTGGAGAAAAGAGAAGAAAGAGAPGAGGRCSKLRRAVRRNGGCGGRARSLGGVAAGGASLVADAAPAVVVGRAVERGPGRAGAVAAGVAAAGPPLRSGASTMIMLRPSSFGAASILAIEPTCSATWSRSFLPNSGWLISRPRNMIVILTLWPSPRNLVTWRVLVSKSPTPILGRYFISLMLLLVALRRDSLARWASSNLNLPKSMIRHTGGLALGATSTRSKSSWRAMASASGSGLIPSCTPSGSTRRTSLARIRSLIRCSLVSGAGAMRHHSFISGPVRKKGGRRKATPATGGRSTRRTNGGRVGTQGPASRIQFSS